MPTEAPEYSTKGTATQTIRSLALLPYLTRLDSSTTMRPVPPREASASNARVLIVDDDVSVTELFARMLRLEGFEVWAAHSADEGLVLAQTHRPHAVILDLRMPLTSGVQVLRSLRAIQGMQHTPVTIVTGVCCIPGMARNDLRTCTPLVSGILKSRITACGRWV